MMAVPYSPVVDEFFAKDVRSQYIAKACPTGVPPLQCIEGTTAAEPYELRTLKRQSQLRYRQLPVSVRLHNMYETRKNAVIACHGCAHEEERVLANPMLANSMLLGQAESNRACNRYIQSSGPVEDMMCRSVENIYMKAVNGSGVFTTACTDGQARYEAYLCQVRGKSTEFRAGQYSAAAKAGAAFAARKLAIARNHICVYEDGLYSKYPRLAGSMRPAFGYYSTFKSPSRFMTISTHTLVLTSLRILSYVFVPYLRHSSVRHPTGQERSCYQLHGCCKNGCSCEAHRSVGCSCRFVGCCTVLGGSCISVSTLTHQCVTSTF